MNNYKFDINENLTWICILCISVFSCTIDNQFSLLILFWTLIIVINGNIKRIWSEKYINISMIVRRSLYVVPLFLPILLGFKSDRPSVYSLSWNIIGFITGLIFISPKAKTWRILLSNDIISLSRKRIKADYFSQWIMNFFGSIGEEMFFRAFIIGYISSDFPLMGVVLSVVMFFLNHYSLKWSDNFTIYDCIVQIIFGFVSAILFLLANSILPCVIMHITYNLPYIIKASKEYRYHYGHKSY